MLNISNNWDADSITAAKDKFFAVVYNLIVKIKKTIKRLLKRL